ncbi:hypothetical protein HK102_009434 [Quaeritorhiza haematococci]|nr:hypothetical protein HK102_009434 [Quaeritorhiza haematococci]
MEPSSPSIASVSADEDLLEPNTPPHTHSHAHNDSNLDSNNNLVDLAKNNHCRSLSFSDLLLNNSNGMNGNGGSQANGNGNGLFDSAWSKAVCGFNDVDMLPEQPEQAQQQTWSWPASLEQGVRYGVVGVGDVGGVGESERKKDAFREGFIKSEGDMMEETRVPSLMLEDAQDLFPDLFSNASIFSSSRSLINTDIDWDDCSSDSTPPTALESVLSATSAAGGANAGLNSMLSSTSHDVLPRLSSTDPSITSACKISHEQEGPPLTVSPKLLVKLEEGPDDHSPAFAGGATNIVDSVLFDDDRSPSDVEVAELFSEDEEDEEPSPVVSVPMSIVRNEGEGSSSMGVGGEVEENDMPGIETEMMPPAPEPDLTQQSKPGRRTGRGPTKSKTTQPVDVQQATMTSTRTPRERRPTAKVLESMAVTTAAESPKTTTTTPGSSSSRGAGKSKPKRAASSQKSSSASKKRKTSTGAQRSGRRKKSKNDEDSEVEEYFEEDEAPSANATITSDEEDDDEAEETKLSQKRLERRRERNRLAARRSRERRTQYIAELEGINAELRKEIAALKAKVQSLSKGSEGGSAEEVGTSSSSRSRHGKK